MLAVGSDTAHLNTFNWIDASSKSKKVIIIITHQSVNSIQTQGLMHLQRLRCFMFKETNECLQKSLDSYVLQFSEILHMRVCNLGNYISLSVLANESVVIVRLDKTLIFIRLIETIYNKFKHLVNSF